MTNVQDEERAVVRLLDPFDGPSVRGHRALVKFALRSQDDGPPTGGPSRYSIVYY
jgi:hypothetical protein